MPLRCTYKHKNADYTPTSEELSQFQVRQAEMQGSLRITNTHKHTHYNEVNQLSLSDHYHLKYSDFMSAKLQFKHYKLQHTTFAAIWRIEIL